MRKRLANSVSLLGRKDGRLPLLSVVCLSVHLLSDRLTWNQPSMQWKRRRLVPVRLAGSFRRWFVKKYCWLICVREKILFQLKIYDRLRQVMAKRTGCVWPKRVWILWSWPWSHIFCYDLVWFAGWCRRRWWRRTCTGISCLHVQTETNY